MGAKISTPMVLGVWPCFRGQAPLVRMSIDRKLGRSFSSKVEKYVLVD